MIPADLLSALRAKDPELWERLVIGMPLKPYGQYIAYTSGEQTVQKFNFSYIPFGELLSEVAFAWLQHCLQEAIRERGWHLLQSQDQDTGRYYADISEIAPGYDGDYWTEKHLYLICEVEGDTEAEALLRAYLAAIA